MTTIYYTDPDAWTVNQSMTRYSLGGCRCLSGPPALVPSFGDDASSAVWGQFLSAMGVAADSIIPGAWSAAQLTSWLTSQFPDSAAGQAPLPDPTDVVSKAQAAVAAGQMTPAQATAMMNAAANVQKSAQQQGWSNAFKNAGEGFLSGVEGLALLALVGVGFYVLSPLIFPARGAAKAAASRFSGRRR